MNTTKTMQMRILNLTQHPATSEQVAQGVFEPTTNAHEWCVKSLLTFDKLPSKMEVLVRARDIVANAKLYLPIPDAAMIGGAPFLMGPLAEALRRAGIKPVYAFSKRMSVEKTLPSGEVVKTSVFVHEGFVNG